MRLGVHLPQYGRAAGPEAIRRAAVQAEELGFDDVWVSDHLVVPDGIAYPPAFLFEPIITLTWAAAATSRVGVGTSVLILPLRNPVHVAKELATLDQLSAGRVVVGAGVGWLEAEFGALGAAFADRGATSDEAIDVFRACWGADDPVTFSGPTVTFEAMKVRPKPAHSIPIWVGGESDRALTRALTRGDGWHGLLTPDAARPIVERLAAERPGPAFTLSMRTTWDGLMTPEADIAAEAEAFAAMGIDHVVAVPTHANLDDWLRSVEALGRILAPYR
jgi:probable F420-dependent oxidoreductase